jgi:hypothetical protein
MVKIPLLIGFIMVLVTSEPGEDIPNTIEVILLPASMGDDDY